MALKWVDGNFNKTAEDARNTYPKDGGWWMPDDIMNYLKLNNAAFSLMDITPYTGESILIQQLQQGNIAILNPNMGTIPYNNVSEQRVGRFYYYDSGHYLVVKGYRVVDGRVYFETYDPNNWNMRYADGQEKGKDRYYLSQDLVTSAANWWGKMIVIQKPANK